MDIKVLDDNPLYKDETYRLKFTFSSKYPIGESAAVTLSRVLSVDLLRCLVMGL